MLDVLEKPLKREVAIKRSVLMRACKMSRSEINEEINRLIDVVLDKSIPNEERELAKTESREFVVLLRRRGER